MVDWAGVCGMPSDDYPGEDGELYHEGEHYDPAMVGHPGLGAIGSSHTVAKRSKPITKSGPSVVCRYCGARGLRWTELESGWRLKDADGEVHSCEQYQKA